MYVTAPWCCDTDSGGEDRQMHFRKRSKLASAYLPVNEKPHIMNAYMFELYVIEEDRDTG